MLQLFLWYVDQLFINADSDMLLLHLNNLGDAGVNLVFVHLKIHGLSLVSILGLPIAVRPCR